MGLVPPPEIPAALRAEIMNQPGDCALTFLTMQPLFPGDIRSHCLGVLQMREIFESEVGNCLTKEEKRRIFPSDNYGSIMLSGLEVTLVEPCLHLSQVILVQYHCWDRYEGRLTGGWREVLQRNTNVLTENTIVQLWSFRRCGKLCLILNVVKDADGNPIKLLHL